MSTSDHSGPRLHAERLRRAVGAWRTQVVALLALAMIGTLGLCLGGAIFLVRRDVELQTEQQVLAIARTVAADPRYAQWVQTRQPSSTGPVQRAAELVRLRSGALFVVVANNRGIRYSHPDPSQIGKHVSTSQAVALAGTDQTVVERGDLGLSARGKVPLRDGQGRIVGSVSVGLPISDVHSVQRRISLLLLGFGAIALGAGLVALAMLWRRMRQVTLGLEADEMADLLREHAAVLGESGDGIVAVDANGTVRVCTRAASRHLGIDVERGAHLRDTRLPEQVVDLLDPTHPLSTVRELAVTGSSILELRVTTVEHDGRDLGRVLVLRDRTDLDDLGRELEATRALTDALRAQTHEHANQLHTLSGLLAFGHVDQARDYLVELGGRVATSDGVADPYLGGLLAAKRAKAAESGVQLLLDPESWLDSPVDHPLDCVTIVGNLVDNAIRAAAAGARRPAEVTVCLLGHGSELLVNVVDSGDGVPPEHRDDIFADGWTTRQEHSAGHGLGLALARLTARRHGGDVELVSAGTPATGGDDRATEGRPGAGHGAAFTARIPDVVTRATRIGATQ